MLKYTGRTPLHLAAMASSIEIVACLINHGARLIARLVDGRTALHIAASRGDLGMVKILMSKSLSNKEEEAEKEASQRDARAESESETSEITLGSDSESESESDSESDSVAMDSFVKLDIEDWNNAEVSFLIFPFLLSYPKSLRRLARPQCMVLQPGLVTK